MRTPRIVEIYHAKFRRDFVPSRMIQQMIVGDQGKVVEFIIVQEQTKSFLDALFDVAVNDGKRFPAAGKSDNRRSPERVNHIRPTRIPPFIIIEKRREIDGVFII